MRSKGFQITRFADDWVITCHSEAEAHAAIAAALRILKQLGVELHPQKTRVVHVRHGFEFLGYKIKRGKQLTLPTDKIRSTARSGALYAFPARSRFTASWIRYVRSLGDACRLKPGNCCAADGGQRETAPPPTRQSSNG